ncbi:hypothetical protein ACU686_37140 [Yinghuangia aomiensis]
MKLAVRYRTAGDDDASFCSRYGGQFARSAASTAVGCVLLVPALVCTGMRVQPGSRSAAVRIASSNSAWDR